MRRKTVSTFALGAMMTFCVTARAGTPALYRPVEAGGQKAKPSSAPAKRAPGLYAIINTTMGTIVCQLFEKETPKTVTNFMDLAEGRKAYLSPRTGRMIKGRFYDGIQFHRVIPGFMIQAGDPTATGRYSPGFTFEDEIRPTLKFDRPGRLAMANRGPNTNGSQFFITVAATPHLNGKHTIFGQVVEGQAVANKISTVKRDANDKPIDPVRITSITFERVQ